MNELQKIVADIDESLAYAGSMDHDTFVLTLRSIRTRLEAAASPGGEDAYQRCPNCNSGNGMRSGCDLCDGSGFVATPAERTTQRGGDDLFLRNIRTALGPHCDDYDSVIDAIVMLRHKAENATPQAQEGMVPAPNWCRTCGKLWRDPLAIFCSDGIHNRSAAPASAAKEPTP